MKLHRKSEAGLTAIVIILIVAIFFGWLFNVSQRECNSNKDCSSESYCGSDFSCHSYPTIHKTVVQYNFFWPSLILGIAIVAAALIFNRNKLKTSFKKEYTEFEEKASQPSDQSEESMEEYYKNSEIKSP